MRKSIPFIFFGLTFIVTFLVMKNVYLFGDDYYYVTFWNGSVSEFFNHQVQHYLLDNGRVVVHLLASTFLSLPMIWWKMLNSFMLSAIVFFGSKIFKKNNWGFMVFFLAICTIGIEVSRQSIYWLTGSFNYVYPICLLFIYWYCLVIFQRNKKHVFLMSFLAFFASATVEQASMMIIGMTILLLVRDWKVNQKLDKKQMIVLAGAFLGAITVFFAPGTFSRIAIENSNPISVFTRIKDLLKFLANTFFFSKFMFPFHFAFFVLAYEEIKRKSKNKFYFFLTCIDILVLVVADFYLPFTATFDLVKIVILGTFIFSYLIISLFIIYFEMKEIKNNYMIYTTAVILLIGSQLMLIVSNTYGYRNTLFGIFMLIMMIAYLACHISLKKSMTRAILSYGVLIIWCFFALKNQFTILKGYQLSHQIEKENIQKINTNVSHTLVLKVPDITYTWSMPYVSEYHKYYYKKYYKIEDINVIWENI